MRKIIFCLSLLWILPHTGQAEESTPIALSLNRTLALAEQRNIEVILADERTRQAVDRLGQAVSYFMPHVTGDVSQSRQTRNLQAFGINIPQAPGSSGNSNGIVGPFNSSDARLTLTQSLFDAEAFARLKSASSGKKFFKAEEQNTKQDVLAFVANLFIEAKRAQEKIGAVKIMLRRDREDLKITSSRAKLGTSSEVDVLESRSRLLQTEYLDQTARDEEESKRLDLLAALGYSASQEVTLVEQPMEDFPFAPEETQNAIALHPETQAASELVKQRKADHWAELLKGFPKISALADYGASGRTLSDSSDTYMVGLKATVPLFEGGRRFFKSRETKSLVRQSEAEVQDTQIRLEDRVLNALRQVHNAQTLIRAKNAQLTALEKQSALSRLAYQQGAASHLSYSETRALLASVRDERQEAQALYAMAQVNLAHALGRMDYFLEQPPEIGEIAHD